MFWSLSQEAIMLIRHAKIITWGDPNQILEEQALVLKDGLIVDFGPDTELTARYPEQEVLDARGQLVLPGNICAHTHFYGAFSRGMAIPGAAPKNFLEILQKLWWPLDLALDEEAVQLSAQVCLIDAIKHGTTTLFDHHASPNFINGSLDVIADVVDQSGLRAVLCYEVTDRNGEAGTKQGIDENLRFIRRARREEIADGRVQGTFGLHASLTLSEKSLEACRQAAPDDVGFHVHVAEAEIDQQDSQAKYGMRVVHRLDRHGMLGANSILVHAVHVDAHEIDLLARTNTWVTHQPRSNMNNAVGIGEVEAMLDAGVKVCLGNDGFSNAMWEEWKTTYLVHKAWQRDPRRMTGTQVAQMAVYHNAALANHYFPGKQIGVISPGAVADLIFVEYHPFTPLAAGNLPWHIIFGFHESMVTTTIVDGNILMRDRVLLTLDEASIAARAREAAPKIWQRYEQFVGSY
jgi:putative selenium metabolism protein SsnA